MEELISIIKNDQFQVHTKKKTRKNTMDEDFMDIDEFNEEEEENYIQTLLEKKKLEDESLEVYFVEA